MFRLVRTGVSYKAVLEEVFRHGALVSFLLAGVSVGIILKNWGYTH
jgi:hypothetical protein